MDSYEISPDKVISQAQPEALEDALYDVYTETANPAPPPIIKSAPALDSQTRWRISMRLVIIGLLLGIRAITAYFTPDLFIQSKVVSSDINSFGFYPPADLMQLRGVLLAILFVGYIYALISDRYFRFMSVAAMVAGCALLWSDIELFMLSSASEITVVSLALLGMRLIAVWLLVQNYLDIHR
ncbi:MAG: hypothetical protein ACPHLL_06570 [Porticoccaceae bacterium]